MVLMLSLESLKYIKYMKYVKNMKGSYDEESDMLQFVFPRLPKDMKEIAKDKVDFIKDVKVKGKVFTVVRLKLSRLTDDKGFREKYEELQPPIKEAINKYLIAMGVPEKRLVKNDDKEDE